ncbi:hypothetical protein WKT22_01736 [Candidatus Lokiarchaeum ossiferum]
MISMDDEQDSKSRRLFKEYQADILEVIQALGNLHRYKILMTLVDHNSDFQELLAILNLGKTATSHHLRKLGDLNLIVKTHRGKYAISHDGKSFLHAIAKGYSETYLKRRFDQQLQTLYNQNRTRFRKKYKMNKFPVKIVSLPPMKVASVRAISPTPENDAWTKLEKYAIKHNLLENHELHPIYGFNNPDPTQGQKEYGYEFWIRVDSFTQSEKDVIIKEIPSALYAVKECNLFEESQSDFFKKNGILESWSQLFHWVEESEYQRGTHQYLEKSLNPGHDIEELILELHMPIINSRKGVGN